jgi:hypothetical protein
MEVRILTRNNEIYMINFDHNFINYFKKHTDMDIVFLIKTRTPLEITEILYNKLFNLLANKDSFINNHSFDCTFYILTEPIFYLFCRQLEDITCLFAQAKHIKT